jgi:hypothetical protein
MRGAIWAFIVIIFTFFSASNEWSLFERLHGLREHALLVKHRRPSASSPLA